MLIKESATQHVTQAGQIRNPAISDNFHRSQFFFRMCGEILLARPHQTLGFAMESGLDDHRGQTEHIGLALILGGRRNIPCDCGASGKQRGFKITGIHGLRLRSQQTITIFNIVTVLRNKQALRRSPMALRLKNRKNRDGPLFPLLRINPGGALRQRAEGTLLDSGVHGNDGVGSKPPAWARPAAIAHSAGKPHRLAGGKNK
jgi:hypothetical protein